jgi:coenzyme F420-0:L-glutamate ligase/coenzyme F420-1:gamma-L-glutamate ligase
MDRRVAGATWIADGTPEDVIARPDREVGRGPRRGAGADRAADPSPRRALLPDAERSTAERDMFVLSGGAAIQSSARAPRAGLASSWISSTLFCAEETRDALGLEDEWIPLGSVAVGPPPAGNPPRGRRSTLGEHLLFRSDDAVDEVPEEDG